MPSTDLADWDEVHPYFVFAINLAPALRHGINTNLAIL